MAICSQYLTTCMSEVLLHSKCFRSRLRVSTWPESIRDMYTAQQRAASVHGGSSRWPDVVTGADGRPVLTRFEIGG